MAVNEFRPAQGSEKGDAWFRLDARGRPTALHKYAGQRRGLRRWLPRVASGRHRRLAKEADLSEFLADREFQWLVIPRLLHREADWISLEYVSGQPLHAGNLDLAARALAEYNAVDPGRDLKPSRYASLRLAATWTPLRKVRRSYRLLHRRRSDIAGPVRLGIWRLVRSVQRFGRPALLNRDVAVKHFLVQPEHCAILDHETAGLSRRWAAMDAVGLATSMTQQMLDLDVIDVWARHFFELRPDWAEMDMVAQVQMGLLYEEGVRMLGRNASRRRERLGYERLRFALNRRRVARYLGRHRPAGGGPV